MTRFPHDELVGKSTRSNLAAVFLNDRARHRAICRGVNYFATYSTKGSYVASNGARRNPTSTQSIVGVAAPVEDRVRLFARYLAGEIPYFCLKRVVKALGLENPHL